MAGPQRRKKTHKGGHALRRLEKTKRLRKGLDQITDEVKKPEKLAFKKTLDEDLPGMGRFYCFACRYDNQLFYFCFFYICFNYSKHCISTEALTRHKSSKPHKRRLKELSVEPYSHEEADRAAGMGSYITPKTQDIKSMIQKAEDSYFSSFSF